MVRNRLHAGHGLLCHPGPIDTTTVTHGLGRFLANRQTRISRRETYTDIVAINSYRVLCALLGLYTSPFA